MSSIAELKTKGKRLAYRDMHTLYETKQKKLDQISISEAMEELDAKDNSDWLKNQLKKRLDPKDKDAVEV